jgi:hypothetical protein
MELTLKRNNYNIITLIMVALVLCLIPISIVIASALTQTTIGMNGVINSQLTVGRNAADDSTRLMDSIWNPAIVHPDSAEGQMAIETEIIFVAFAILLILYEVETKEKPLVILLTVALIIYMAFALLPAINDILRNILGY